MSLFDSEEDGKKRNIEKFIFGDAMQKTTRPSGGIRFLEKKKII